jgi:transcriptional repressor NrdR
VQCPLCEASSRVLESRSADGGDAVRRRRECSSCGHRFTTYERYEQALFVRKRDGSREPFDRAKLRGGLSRAAHKRPVTEVEIDAIADRVQSTLVEAGGELPSQAIGQLCLEGLAEVDRGAYLQFAGTLPSPEESLVPARSEFAGSFPAGSVRPESNPPESTS